MELHFDSNVVRDMINKKLVYLKDELTKAQIKRDQWFVENERYSKQIFAEFKRAIKPHYLNEDSYIVAKMDMYNRMLPTGCLIRQTNERLVPGAYDKALHPPDTDVYFKWRTKSTHCDVLYNMYHSVDCFRLHLPAKEVWIDEIGYLEELLRLTPPDIEVTLTGDEYSCIKTDDQTNQILVEG